MESLHCVPSSENLGEATGNNHINKKQDDYGNILSKLIGTMVFNVSKEISTQILEKCLKNK